MHDACLYEHGSWITTMNTYQATDLCAHTTHGISNQHKHTRWQGEPRSDRMCSLSYNRVTPLINYGGWTKDGVHGKDWDVHAVSTSMTVAGEVGRALRKEHVGLQHWHHVSGEKFWKRWQLLMTDAFESSLPRRQSTVPSVVALYSAWQNMHAKVRHAKEKHQQNYLHSNGCYTLNWLNNSANGIYAP